MQDFIGSTRFVVFKVAVRLALLAWLTLLGSTQAELVTLYDGSGFPAAQPWLTFGADTFNGWSQESVAGGVRLTTDLQTRSGYSNYFPLPSPVLKNSAFPSLRRADGFELSFRTRLISEGHSNSNRAGYSVILLAEDARGIELGFWQTEIWAQNADFTHAETVAIDTTLQRDYRLEIIGDQYQLFDGATSLLTGGLRTYSNPAIPYTLSNYLFLGDNTTSGSASVVQGPIRLESNLSSVPEPSSLVLSGSFVAGLWSLGRNRRKKS